MIEYECKHKNKSKTKLVALDTIKINLFEVHRTVGNTMSMKLLLGGKDKIETILFLDFQLKALL